MDRHLERDRHPGHHDRSRVEEVRAAIRTGRHAPLAVDGKLIEVDTTRAVEVADVAGAINDFALLSRRSDD